MIPEYLKKIPQQVPAGRVVVHNTVRPTRHLGSRGFRAWLDVPSPEIEVCPCGWASELGVHYRVKDHWRRKGGSVTKA